VREWSAEVTVDAELATRLIREQFLEVELRSIFLLGEGWDNTMWLVDDEWVFRFPRRSYVLSGIRNEIELLPRLAPLLPLPIPVPALVGEPSEIFPWPFYAGRLLPGRELADAELDDTSLTRLARPLAEFLRTLHAVELDAELPIDPVGRADMTVRVPRARQYLDEVESLGLWRPPPLVDELLEAAGALPEAQPTATCHGDLHLRHLLVGDQGQPTGVIDWIDLSRNDPSVDLVLYWAALPPEGRAEFLEVYGTVTEEQLLRARVLSLFLCGVLAAYGEHEGRPSLKRAAIAGLARTSAERS
jgi:aminoglycoside phosphotransferase (APT) family kinase protein